MRESLARLIDVKTIVTFIITIVLAYLSITGKLTPEQFMIIATMIYTYFFTKTPAQTPNTTTSTETTTIQTDPDIKE